MKRPSKKSLIYLVILTFVGTTLLWAGFFAVNFVRDIYPNFLLPPSRITVVLGREFSQGVEEQIASYGFVNFDQLADFEWNQMFIVTPYQDPWRVLDDNGIRRQRINTGIKFEDWQSLLVFLNDDRVVAYINLPRGIADFRGMVNDGRIFQRENTTFPFSPQ